MLHRQRGGGVTWVLGLDLPRLHSSICLIPLWLSALKKPSRFGRGRKAEDVSDPPPPPNRGVMRPATDGVCTRLCTGPHGVAHVLIYPCGKAWKNPLSPRASSCRIGPRRQGFASPLRALDGSGPIRKTRCLRGERGGSGRGARGRVASPLAHDKGYYHSCFGRDAESQLSAIQDS